MSMGDTVYTPPSGTPRLPVCMVTQREKSLTGWCEASNSTKYLSLESRIVLQSRSLVGVYTVLAIQLQGRRERLVYQGG